MDGRRFGIGAAAGLLLALAIVASYGVVSPSASPFSPAQGRNVPAASVTTTATTWPYFWTTGPSATTSQGNLSSLNGNIGPTNPDTTAASNSQSGGLVFSSSLATANQQPSLSRALMLAPIVVASLLGVLLYRASARSSSDQETD